MKLPIFLRANPPETKAPTTSQVIRKAADAFEYFSGQQALNTIDRGSMLHHAAKLRQLLDQLESHE